jgi:hypothetical protein
VRIGFIQLQLQLHHRLHLHVVLKEAAAERGLVVGLSRRGLDGRLHPDLRHGGGDDPDAPHGCAGRHYTRRGPQPKQSLTQTRSQSGHLGTAAAAEALIGP